MKEKTIKSNDTMIRIFELVMLSNHLFLCHPLLLLPSTFPRIIIFTNELALCISWPKYWSFSFSVSASSEYSRLISFRIDWFHLLAVQRTWIWANWEMVKDREAWHAVAHAVTKSWTQLSDWTTTDAGHSQVHLDPHAWSYPFHRLGDQGSFTNAHLGGKAAALGARSDWLQSPCSFHSTCQGTQLSQCTQSSLVWNSRAKKPAL